MFVFTKAVEKIFRKNLNKNENIFTFEVDGIRSEARFSLHETIDVLFSEPIVLQDLVDIQIVVLVGVLFLLLGED